MRILKNKWFRIASSATLALLIVASTLLGLSLRIPVESTEGFVSIGVGNTVYAQEPLGEVIEKRTVSSKTTYLGDGRYALDATIGAVHYRDAGGDFQEINNQFVAAAAPWDWAMTDAGYQVRVKNDFTAGQVIEFSKADETVALQPMALEWTNDLDQIQQVSMPQDVAPIVSNESSELLPSTPNQLGTIRWKDAYGSGLDFQWQVTPTRLSKILQIDSLGDLSAPAQYVIDGGNPVLKLNLIFAPSKDVEIYVDGGLWNQKDKVQTFDVIEFRKSGEVLWGFMPLRYWDSEGNEGQSVATLRKAGNKLYIEVRVPYEWLKTAVYPVFVDTDVDEQVGASTDDTVVSQWQPSGGWSIDNTYRMQVGCNDPTGSYKIGGGMRFQAVALPNAQSLDTAYITLTAWYSGSGATVRTRFRGEDVDDATTFSTLANYQGRHEFFTPGAGTTAYVDWDGLGWWSYDTTKQSPELKSIVEEIISRAGWSSGNDLVIFWDDHDNRSTQSSGVERKAFSYDTNSTKAPVLHVEYTVATPDITVSPTTYDFGTVTASSTPSTATNYFTITNNSTMQTDQTIAVTTNSWSGGVTWTHSDTATAGVDTAGLLSNRGGTWGVGDIIVKYSSPNYIYENCPASTGYSFGLKLIAPTEYTDGVQKQIIVRVSAVAG